MKKPLHQLTMECIAAARPANELTDASFTRSGGQAWRQEREQRREGDVEQDEIEAARAWLRHVEAELGAKKA